MPALYSTYLLGEFRWVCLDTEKLFKEDTLELCKKILSSRLGMTGKEIAEGSQALQSGENFDLQIPSSPPYLDFQVSRMAFALGKQNTNFAF